MIQALDNDEIMRRSNTYYRSGALDAERWAKIAEVPDYDRIITDFDWAGVLNVDRGEGSAAILDCGCGLGYFPRQLTRRDSVPPGVLFDYDTVDSSSYSLTENRNNLQHPFYPRNSFNSAIENFEPVPWIGGYEIIWCMHSLYTVPRARLPKVVTTLSSLLAPGGRCFIYLPRKHSAYMELFDLYLDELDRGQIQPYLTAEEVLAELAARGFRSVECVDCRFDHWIEASEPHTLATYLNQICLRPDPLTAGEWQRNAALGRYLDRAFDHERSVWRFRQELSLISFS